MKRLVCIEGCAKGFKFFLDSYFPTEFTARIDDADIKLLGKRLCAFGKSKRPFCWKANAVSDWGSFDFEVKGEKEGKVCFRDSLWNGIFDSPSDCENYYDEISFEGMLQFGEEILNLDEGKSAVLCEFKK